MRQSNNRLDGTITHLHPLEEPQGFISLSAVSRLEKLFYQAIAQRASDLHFEPHTNGLNVRFRIDGLLQSQPMIPLALSQQVISRLKVLAQLDITQRRQPQDGQFTLTLPQGCYPIRLSSLPTLYGEKIVMRVLSLTKQAPNLQQLGLSKETLTRYKNTLKKPQGLILITGPTGSGKTSTLYAGLAHLNHPKRNICSVEDPIEIPLAGITQTQVHPKIGLDFPFILRALLRQDPDVIMIGEIRDHQTADIALRAAQTGHLVLSTLHTNSSRETLSRLAQLGLPHYLVANCLSLIISQRLLRKLCLQCRTYDEKQQHYDAVGCSACQQGYSGRLVVSHALLIDDKLQQRINESGLESQHIAMLLDKDPLYEIALKKVTKGETTLKEVERVLAPSSDSSTIK